MDGWRSVSQVAGWSSEVDGWRSVSQVDGASQQEGELWCLVQVGLADAPSGLEDEGNRYQR